jgi:lipoprotein-anchoring transpeptidase ErfK/SrfK
VVLRALAALSLWVLSGAVAADRLMPYVDMDDRYTPMLNELRARYPELAPDVAAVVSVGEQRLYLYRGDEQVANYPVSTSRFGTGSQLGSLKTPMGAHRVRRKIGQDAPIGRIFRGRADTGEQARILTEPVDNDDDHVTTRILWLDGLEPGRNLGGEVDSFRRYIYIHGTHEEGLIGRPASDGCVRMRNVDVVEVFGRLPENALVVIVH